MNFPAVCIRYAFLQERNEEALLIRRRLAEENPRAYLPKVAITLINLGIFYLQDQPDQGQAMVLAQEVIDISQQFPQVPIVQQYDQAAQQVLSS
ncbi:MAG: hypothetical protein AAGD25_27685 [Cyanobacteria bacterium P01_F01_bin.150]